MPEHYDFDLDPVSFITIGTQGPAGDRTFFLQAAQRRQVVSLLIEKEHAIGLSVNLGRLIEEIKTHDPDFTAEPDPAPGNMALIEPVQPNFRVDNIGIGVDEARHLVIIVTSELVDEETTARRARFVATYEQVQALSRHTADIVQHGRPICPLCGEPIDPDGHFCPPRNGHARPPE